MLAVEHIWHGEIVPWPPFLTAMNNPADIGAMLVEIATVGVTMMALVTAVWGLMVLVSNRLEAEPFRPRSPKRPRSNRMCLIITASAAVAVTFVWYFKARESKIRLAALVLMYWGAALMWLADGFFSIAEGGPFLDLSADDALLGLIVVLCGLVAWLALLLLRDPKRIFASFKRTKTQTQRLCLPQTAKCCFSTPLSALPTSRRPHALPLVLPAFQDETETQ